MRMNATVPALAWARSEFGQARLGDARRTERLVAMGACACDAPSGTVSDVFHTDKEREGAYDLLENEQVEAAAIVAATARATAERCRGLPFVYVAVDGTSLSLVDLAGEKDFGAVGTNEHGRRGLKVVDALAVDPYGVPLGWLALNYWARSNAPGARPRKGTHARQARPVEDKETYRWIEAIRSSRAVLDAVAVRGWFQLDREADGRDMLLELSASDHYWTVRSSADRSIEIEGGDTGRLREELAREPALGSYSLEVSGKSNRRARTANMVVRVARVKLRLRDRRKDRVTVLEVTSVWAREEGTTPAGERPIDWLLHTNFPVSTFEDARRVVLGYAQRWRVEEGHKSWKSGVCNVEQTQLRSAAAVQKWATILAAVAARIERLKRLARAQPAAPASVDLTPVEIRALLLLKRRFKKRNERVPDAMPTMAQAVLWIAELGGYTGKSSGGPPGATTIRRGLDRLGPAAQMLGIIEEAGR